MTDDLPRTVHLVSLGCARNQVDSEVMLGRLTGAGWRVTDDPGEADAIVVNTCSFILAAADESIDTILSLAPYRSGGRCRRLVVVGCLPERYREAITAALPEVDRFLGTGAFDCIVEAIEDTPNALPACHLPDPDRAVYDAAGLPRWRAPAPSAYLRIAEGCDRHCTYCIIPKLRGHHQSVPPEPLLEEARRLAGEGVGELVLVGQETTAYGSDLDPPISLAGLLEALAGLEGTPWVRLLYGHPESLDEETIRAVGRLAPVCPYFDLPVQHVSDRVLRRMGRKYTRADLEGLFTRIRRQVPEASLRTTLLVGFPGESDEDFEVLMDFVERVRFDHLGVFVYSDHEDLPAHRLDDPVPPAVARRRYDRLMARQRELSREANRRHRGRIYEVLIEKRLEAGLYEGRTRFQAPEVDGITYVRGSHLSVGARLPVVIRDSLEYDLTGEPA